jgi:hypothetical protein
MGMPGKRGEWNLDAIDKWRSLRNSARDRSGTLTPTGKAVKEVGDQQDDSYHVEYNLDAASRAKLRAIEADALKKEADAHLKQLQLQKKLNANIVDLEDVEAFLTQFMADSRKLLLRVPPTMRRFGPQAVKACQQQIELKLHGMEKIALRLVDLRDE